VVLDVPAELVALGDEQLLVQVVSNLVVNAAQAIPPERRDGRVRLRADRAAGGVRLLVEDNGSGMSPETMQRLFEPFFTTKPTGSGTGLGLAVSRGFVMSMGGSLRFESELGRGTTAVLFLREGPPAGEEEVQAAAAHPLPGRLRLLLVDDEPHALSSLRRLLSSRYEVAVAATVDEALRRAREAPFDLVLCDVLMPFGGGEALYRALLGDQPELAARLIFLTGGVAQQEMARFLEEQPQPLLHKPLDPQALAEAGRRLLAS
jgi:CheY-like chemotaxis protein/anti-sigma regulatory factor (Ser/Thr protein kinase)